MLKRFGNFESHILLHGSCGAGKRTLLYNSLQELFRSSDAELLENQPQSVIRVKTKRRKTQIKPGSNHDDNTPEIQTFEFPVRQTTNCIELLPAASPFQHHEVIETLISDIVVQLRPGMQNQDDAVRFLVIILHELDLLPIESQGALHRAIESHSRYCRFVLIAERLTTITKALKSRCFPVRISAPTQQQLLTVLNTEYPNPDFKLEERNLLVKACNRNYRILHHRIQLLKDPQQNAQIVERKRQRTEYVTNIVARVLKTPFNVQDIRDLREKNLEQLQQWSVPQLLRTILFTAIQFTTCATPLSFPPFHELHCGFIALTAKYEHELVSSIRQVICFETYLLELGKLHTGVFTLQHTS